MSSVLNVYIVVETTGEDFADFNPVKGVFKTWARAHECLSELAEYFGHELDPEAFEFELDGYYASIEKHVIVD